MKFKGDTVVVIMNFIEYRNLFYIIMISFNILIGVILDNTKEFEIYVYI